MESLRPGIPQEHHVGKICILHRLALRHDHALILRLSGSCLLRDFRSFGLRRRGLALRYLGLLRLWHLGRHLLPADACLRLILCHRHCSRRGPRRQQQCQRRRQQHALHQVADADPRLFFPLACHIRLPLSQLVFLFIKTLFGGKSRNKLLKKRCQILSIFLRPKHEPRDAPIWCVPRQRGAFNFFRPANPRDRHPQHGAGAARRPRSPGPRDRSCRTTCQRSGARRLPKPPCASADPPLPAAGTQP